MKYITLKYLDFNNKEHINIQKVNDDGSLLTFPSDENNTDYQAYLKWVEAGNTPEPADE